MDFLSEFEFDIKHMKGKENEIENSLSKHAHALMETSVSGVSTDFMEHIRN